ncbi:SUKH-3 domain-containing protein [Micromonospora globispora]|uniref:SUKH-3 domain-containing protein n=1 Tax=Micromonospora globispora TaxID=1450148 RepID=UPI000F5EA68C
MNDFSAETRRVLLEAGWRPGRRADTTAWRTPLEAGGFDMHQAAERFLAEFGRLTFAHRGSGSRRRVSRSSWTRS